MGPKEYFIVSVILLITAGICKIIYDYRKSIFIYLKKQKLKILPASFNVALSIEFQEGLNSGNYHAEIKNNLLKTIDEIKLTRLIKLMDFSDVYKFNSKEEAENFLRQKNLDLIIWGNFSQDNLKMEDKNINELNLNFTFGHPNDPQNKIGEMLLLDINSKLAKKNYRRIVEDSSYKDIKIISNNLFDVSVYIIGVTMKLYGKIGVSLNLFESLYSKLTKSNDPFVNYIIPHMLNCYELTIINATFNRNLFAIGKDCCRKMLEFKNDDFFALASMAFLQYRTGEVNESQKTVERLAKLYPNNPLTEVDVAFFRILEKDYKGAFKHYRNLIKFKSNQLNFNPIIVVDFLSENYEKFKEPAMLYGSGIISYYYADKKIAKYDLKEFIKKASEQSYKPMYRSAKKLLKAC